MGCTKSTEKPSNEGAPAKQLLSDGSTKWKQIGITVAGNVEEAEGGSDIKLNQPYGLTFDSKHQYFYVADYQNGRIQRYPVDGGDDHGVTVIQLGETTVSRSYTYGDNINKADSVFADRNGNIFVSEGKLPCRLLKLSPDGTLTTAIERSDSTFQCCTGIYIDRNDNIYVADWDHAAVFKFDKNGKNRKIVAGGNGYGDAPNQLYHPHGVFVAEKTGNIYVVDYINHRIQRWAPGSKVGVTVCGGNGQGNGLNQLNQPWSVVVDANEKQIYVGDGENGRVVRWSAGAKEGKIIVGRKNNDGDDDDKPKELSRVGGIQFDQNGNLYVTDLGTNKVRKFLIDN